MKRLICCLLLACVSFPAIAQDAAEPDLSQNAALRYWMAFSVLGTPNEENGQSRTEWYSIEIEQARAALAADEEALGLLAWATQIDACDWGVNREAGPYALLPHLGQARSLARFAMLRARIRLHDGDTTGAVDDLLAVMKLSRAFESNRILISSLVGLSIESIAVPWIAANLSSFDDDAIRALVDGMDGLPPRSTIGAVIEGERSLMLGWWIDRLRQAQQDGAEAADLEQIAADLGFGASYLPDEPVDIVQWLEWAEQAHDAYDEAARVADLPYAEYREAIGDLKAGFEASDNQVVLLFMPSVAAVRRSYDRAQANRAMLQAMFAIRLDDGADLADHLAMQDPFGEGTFEMVIERDDETGELVYGLRSALPDRDGGRVELHTDAPLIGQR